MKNIKKGTWTKDEHEMFRAAWKEGLSARQIADRVGTRTRKQVESHAQKFREKIQRHQEMKKKGRSPPRAREEHRLPDHSDVDDDAPDLLTPPSSPVAVDMDLLMESMDLEEPLSCGDLSAALSVFCDDDLQFLSAALDDQVDQPTPMEEQGHAHEEELDF